MSGSLSTTACLARKRIRVLDEFKLVKLEIRSHAISSVGFYYIPSQALSSGTTVLGEK